MKQDIGGDETSLAFFQVNQVFVPCTKGSILLQNVSKPKKRNKHKIKKAVATQFIVKNVQEGNNNAS